MSLTKCQFPINNQNNLPKVIVMVALRRTKSGRTIGGDSSCLRVRVLIAVTVLLVSTCVIGVRGRALYQQFVVGQQTAPKGEPNQVSRQAQEKAAPYESSVSVSPLRSQKEQLLLLTDYGTIKIDLRHDFSPESIDYIRAMAQEPCERCYIYGTRTAKPKSHIGVIQATMGNEQNNVVPYPETGPCPPGLEHIKNRCPADTECDCNGPIMTKGMVAWSTGKTGPSFFINTFDIPARWWGTTHTVFGEVHDEPSWSVLLKLFDLPGRPQQQRRVASKDGQVATPQKVDKSITILRNPIRYKMKLIESPLL